MLWMLEVWLVVTVLAALLLVLVVVGQAVAARTRQVLQRLEHVPAVDVRPRSA